MKRGVLYMRGELDVLDYYSRVSQVLRSFLRGRELATKTELKNFKFLKRGSNSPPLFIEDMKQVDEKMLNLRTNHLDKVKDRLTLKQILIWQYFVPRKPVNFFYATNGENPGKPMDRVFIDIDRQASSSEDARQTCLALVKLIKNDKDFNKLLGYRLFIMWTGSSFHIYLLLNKKIDLDFYQRYLSYGDKKPDSFIIKWARVVSEQIGINVKAGHEREENSIILDSSNTPSGKLARVPFSLHIKGTEIDGIAVPVSEQEIEDKNLINKLEKLTPDLVLRNITDYKKLLT